MKKLLLSLSLALAASVGFAQPNYGSLPPLHVDGNQLRDAAGNKVVLHGFMDTPSPYFNENRWGNSATDGNISSCLSYFNRIFTATTDSTQGAYSRIFRLHLDPCWTNDNSVTNKSFTQKDGKTYDPNGTEVSGEANTIHYSGTRLTKYMKTLYWKLAQYSLKHGMYVIMRPPGVCPGDIYVGDYYQQYLIDVWDRVTKNDSVLKYYGHVGIELANEPVRIKNSAGVDNSQAHTDFFQPIVDKIRANGFKGIIWIPGTGWQSSYEAYAECPIKDPLNNIGFAVHDYCGWYGTSDTSYDSNNAITQFGKQVPVACSSPIVITEVDWSPKKEGTGHYNEHGEWVESNYGTWATGSTSKWGKAYKATLDYYDNISMTLSGSHCYYDWNTYKSSGYKTVVPAFQGVDEACGEACFKWYAEWAKVDYPSFEYYENVQYPENPLDLAEGWFQPNLLYVNPATYSSTYNKVSYKKGGCAGWRFDSPEGLDLSDCESIKISFVKAPVKNTYLKIYDNSCNANYFGDFCRIAISGSKEATIELKDLKTQDGNALDLSHIRIIGVESLGATQDLYFKSASIVKGSTGITTHHTDASNNVAPKYYSLSGVLLDGPQKGVNIVVRGSQVTKEYHK